MIIKSERQFGVEIEFYAPNEKAYRSVSNLLNVHRDGSLDGKQFGLEYVSRILCGSKGEKELRDASAILTKLECSCQDPRTSMHIHLDGKFGELNIQKYKTPEPGVNVAFSRRVLRELGEDNCIAIALGQGFRPDTVIKSKVDDITYYAFAKVTRHPKLNYDYYRVGQVDRFKFVRNALYFYVQYSDVIEALVNNSRKFGNTYCIPIGSSYDLATIEQARTIDDLKNIWYKGRYGGDRYDDSRYHSVNFHSLFYRPGTIEVRCHGGTTNADKILLWVRLHQHILDKLETMELSDIQIQTNDVFKEFIKFISDDELLVEYVKRLLGYFSGVKV